MESSLKGIIDKLSEPFEVFEGEEFKNVQSEIEGRFKVVCPVTQQVDELWLRVKLIPNNDGQFIEYMSFYRWLLSLEKQDLGIEGSCDLIYKEIEKLCKPTMLEVIVETGYKVINQKAIRRSWHKYLEKK